MRFQATLFLTVTAFFVLIIPAKADVNQMKLYKEAFPGSTLKCISCHIDAMPKKDDGKHELNDYGLAVKSENPSPDAETYKKIGKLEDFKSSK